MEFFTIIKHAFAMFQKLKRKQNIKAELLELFSFSILATYLYSITILFQKFVKNLIVKYHKHFHQKINCCF